MVKYLVSVNPNVRLSIVADLVIRVDIKLDLQLISIYFDFENGMNHKSTSLPVSVWHPESVSASVAK